MIHAACESKPVALLLAQDLTTLPPEDEELSAVKDAVLSVGQQLSRAWSHLMHHYVLHFAAILELLALVD